MAKADPKSGNQCEQLLAEAEIRQLAAEVERRIREGLRKGQADAGPGAVKNVDDITDLVEKMLTSPAAGYVAKIEIGLWRPSRRGRSWASATTRPRSAVGAIRQGVARDYHPTTVAGETLWSLPAENGSPQITLGVHGKYFVIGIGEGEAEAIVNRMKGHPPPGLPRSASNSPSSDPPA